MHQENFIRFIQFEKRYSSHTVIAYKKDLLQFYDFILKTYQVNTIENVGFQMIRGWIISLSNAHVTPRSINRKISALKSYYKYLLRQQIIFDNPMARIVPPKSGKSLPEFVSEAKMDLLFDEGVFSEDFNGTRDRLILEIFYCTGMRLSELINLSDNDVDILNRRIKVMGKRNKERIIPFTKTLEDSIVVYKDLRNKVVDSDEQISNFFVTDKGKKIYKELVYRVVRFYLSGVTTLNKRSPHVLRHTFATHMLNNGADINAIKELLGHANLSATQIYTHNTIEKLKSIYEQSHPRA